MLIPDGGNLNYFYARGVNNLTFTKNLVGVLRPSGDFDGIGGITKFGRGISFISFMMLYSSSKRLGFRLVGSIVYLIFCMLYIS